MEETITKDTESTIKKYRFTIEEYHLMGEVGIIAPDRHVELINGEIVEMSPIKSLHAGTVKLLTKILVNLLGDKIVLGVHDPVELNEFTEPEPDLSILKFRSDYYIRSHPKPDEVLFLIEVANSSLHIDRQLKLPLYAEAGIPEVWVVCLSDRQIEVYTKPVEKSYSQINIFRNGDTIKTDLIENLPVDSILI